VRFRRQSDIELDELEDEFPSKDEMLDARLSLRFAGLPDDVGDVLEVSTNERWGEGSGVIY
jgi:hypothetical protein